MSEGGQHNHMFCAYSLQSRILYEDVSRKASRLHDWYESAMPGWRRMTDDFQGKGIVPWLMSSRRESPLRALLDNMKDRQSSRHEQADQLSPSHLMTGQQSLYPDRCQCGARFERYLSP